jgi:uncharacterized RDD family membrane protein YckC
MDEATTNLASRWQRLAGSFIDGIFSLVIIVPIMFATGMAEQLINEQQMSLRQEVSLFAIGWIVFLILNGYLLHNKGQTIGKVFMKTRIVNLYGNIPEFGRLFVFRYLIPGMVMQIPIFGGIAAIVNALFIFGKQRRCLHDYIAGTRVITA